MTIMMMPRNTGTNGRARRAVAILAGALLIGACDFDILDTNAPTDETLTGSPTRQVLASAATGIFARAFNDLGTEIQFYAIYGREGYNLQGNDPRETQEQIHGPRDPAGRNSGIWTGQYNAIRNINTYLAALPNATGLNAEELRASAGFAKTLKAWHLARLAVRTGELGIPLDVDRDIPMSRRRSFPSRTRSPTSPGCSTRRTPTSRAADPPSPSPSRPASPASTRRNVRPVQPRAGREGPRLPRDLQRVRVLLGPRGHGARRVVHHRRRAARFARDRRLLRLHRPGRRTGEPDHRVAREQSVLGTRVDRDGRADAGRTTRPTSGSRGKSCTPDARTPSRTPG